MPFAFLVVNGYFNGRRVGALSPAHDASWAADPRFVAGEFDEARLAFEWASARVAVIEAA